MTMVVMGASVHAALPEHAHVDTFDGGWDCDEGYVKKEGRCVSLVLPASAQENMLGDGWVCKKGYVKEGEACRPVRVPSNAERDTFGNGWRCRRGYFQDGSSCVVIKIPLHAQLDAAGADWQCERGYKKKINVCVDMEPAERARQDKYYQELYAQRKEARGPETAPCRAGYNKCTSSCAGLERKTPEMLLRTDDVSGACCQACGRAEALCAQEKLNSGCQQFAVACRQACPEDVAVCLSACQDGSDRCMYQARQILLQ